MTRLERNNLIAALFLFILSYALEIIFHLTCPLAVAAGALIGIINLRFYQLMVFALLNSATSPRRTVIVSLIKLPVILIVVMVLSAYSAEVILSFLLGALSVFPAAILTGSENGGES